MEDTVEESVQPEKKRKRSNDQDSETIETEISCIENLPSTSQEQPSAISPTRKRKESESNSDQHVPKRVRKFFYLTQSMTKHRKPPKPVPKTVGQATKSFQKTIIKPPSQPVKKTITKIGADGKVCLINPAYMTHDLFFNDEKNGNYENSKKQDLSFNIVDEIALEGLDGITVEAFWKRLRVVFPNPINKKMADRLWRTICNNKRINICILEEPRDKLVVNYNEKTSLLTSFSQAQSKPQKDIYPSCLIRVGPDVQGSCSTFATRKENNGIKKFSMDKALERFDHQLVLVADQMLRNKAIINEETDPNLELLDVEYCCLEKIGRSRYEGEITQGKADTNIPHHHRKSLIQSLLIVNQGYAFKSPRGNMVSAGILHLTRFYHKYKNRRVLFLEQLASYLRDKPNNLDEIATIRLMFGPLAEHFTKIQKSPEFRQFFKTTKVPYRLLFPTAPFKQYMSKTKHVEKQVYVIKMLDPSRNVTAFLEPKDDKEIGHGRVEFKQPGAKIINYDQGRDLFLYILSKGSYGVTMSEIHEHFQLDFLSIRLGVSKLLQRRLVDCFKVDMGRQHTQRFFANALSCPDIELVTEPKEYYVNEKIKEIALKGYENIENIEEDKFYKETTKNPSVPAQAHFTIFINALNCSVFLTGIDLSTTEELTIYDIVIKGRDKLLLNNSNLIFEEYENEWEDYILKSESEIKSIDLFENGIGKLIYGYLTSSIQLNLEADNEIIFELDKLDINSTVIDITPSNVKLVKMQAIQNLIGECYEIDKITKIYIFEAMFNENHINTHVMHKLQNIVERCMKLKGKKKRAGLLFSEAMSDQKADKSESSIDLTSGVFMEKFMGPTPILYHTELTEDNFLIEYYISTPPKQVNKMKIFETDDPNVTAKHIKRANIILELINENKIVKNVSSCAGAVKNIESAEGSKIIVCLKSIKSLVAKLIELGYIKVIKVVMSSKNQENVPSRAQVFVCLPSVNIDDALIKSTLDQMKMRLMVEPSRVLKKVQPKKQESPFSAKDVRNSIIELKSMCSNEIDKSYKFNREIGKQYGFCPKFTRIRVLHEFFYFVIREAQAIEPLEQREVFDLCKKLKIKINPEELLTLPPIYHNEISWKTFIPALSASQHPKGWAFQSDLVLRMPLSVFVKVYNILYELPELEDYLNHPLKRHMLIKHLPVSLRHVLLYKRKYIVHIYETLQYLCYFGLLQMGAKSFKEKDQVFLYLNKKATLLDTTTSKPGYNKVEDKSYKKLVFEFHKSSDVEMYWSEMFQICINTQLGKRKVVDGTTFVIEHCHSKPQLMKALEAQGFNEAVQNDKGDIPGDRRGAAGFDSSLWTYVKRNWVGKVRGEKQQQNFVKGLKNERVVGKNQFQPIIMTYGNLIKQKEKSKGKAMIRNEHQIGKKQQLKGIAKLNKKKFKRLVKIPLKKVREYNDAVDKKIMMINKQKRVEWDQCEIDMARLSRVVSVFLCPMPKKQTISYQLMRDTMHRIYPKSKNKTARALQRKIYSFLVHDEKLKIMESNVENLMNFSEVAKYFEQIRNRYKYDMKLTEAEISVCYVYLFAFVYKHKSEAELHLLGNMASVDYFSAQYIEQFETLISINDNSSNNYKEAENVDDIKVDTIKSVMHCTLNCKKKSPGWAFQLYYIYNKYPDNLIRRAVDEMYRSHMLVSSKNTEEKLVNSWHMPMKLSMIYMLMMNSTYNKEIFGETYRKFQNLLIDLSLEINDGNNSEFLLVNELNLVWERNHFEFDIPEKGVILDPNIEDHSDLVDELAKRFRLYLIKVYEMKCEAKRKDKDSTGSSSESESNLKEKNVDEIKMQVRNLILRVPYLLEGNLERMFKSMLETSVLSEVNEMIPMLTNELKNCAKKLSKLSDEMRGFIESIQVNASEQNALLRNLSKIVFAIQTIQKIGEQSEGDSRTIDEKFKQFESEEFDDWEESETRVKLFKHNQSNGMDVCLKNAAKGNIPTLEEIKEGIMLDDIEEEKRTMPHITDLIVFLVEDRFPELAQDRDMIEKMKEHFVLQYPKFIKYEIEEKDEFLQVKQIQNVGKKNLSSFAKSLEENLKGANKIDYNLESLIKDYSDNEQEVWFIVNLVGFVKSKEELGASVEKIKQLSGDTHLDLEKILNYLCEKQILKRVGISSLIYVHRDYQSNWLTETFTLKSEEIKVFDSKEKEEVKKIQRLIGERLKSTEPLKVQIKPWSKLDGSLNFDLLTEYLCGVLSFCFDFPNSTFPSICQQFCFIKPADVYSLLEVLEKINCIEICYYKNLNITLFSSRSIIQHGKATCLNRLEDMYIRTLDLPSLNFGDWIVSTQIC